MNTYINAPEDATHTYDLVGGYTGFYRLSGGKWCRWDSLSSGWCKVLDNTPFQTPIPIKEDNNSVSGILNSSQIAEVIKELEDNDNKVDWDGEGLPPVGIECEAVFIEHEHKGYGEFLILGYYGDYVWMEYIGDLSNKSKHYTAKVDMVKFRKPESEADRLQRERIESGKAYYELISSIESELMCPEHHGYPNMWGELRSEWQEVYIRQAEVLGFSKESC